MRFFVRRAIFYLLTAWAAVTINFIIPRLMPGDPVAALLARSQGRIGSDAAEAIRILFGLDEDTSLWQQYVDYWGLLLHGDLGISFTNFPTPVIEIIRAVAAVDRRPGRHRDGHQLRRRHARSAPGIGWRRGHVGRRAAADLHLLLGGAVLLARAHRDRALLGDARLVPGERQLRPQPGARR